MTSDARKIVSGRVASEAWDNNCYLELVYDTGEIAFDVDAEAEFKVSLTHDRSRFVMGNRSDDSSAGVSICTSSFQGSI
jgi:hypothetical protein